LIEEIAQVVDVEGDHLVVEIQRQSACGGCAVNKGCGTAVLQKVLGRKRSLIELSYDQKQFTNNKISIGDSVILGLPERALVKGSAAVYALPLCFLILFAILGEIVAEQMSVSNVDSISIMFAIVGLMVALIWLRLFSSRVSNDPQYQPRVLRKMLTQVSLPVR
jgi:sigma-E factor negative regulatory protein RseC